MYLHLIRDRGPGPQRCGSVPVRDPQPQRIRSRVLDAALPAGKCDGARAEPGRKTWEHHQHVIPKLCVRFRNFEALAARRCPEQLERGPPLLLPHRCGQVEHRLRGLQRFFLAGRPGFLFLLVLARPRFQQAAIKAQMADG
ncbi:hypothetical protein F5883DRAFT_718849 [Diaporthe sp. PMI_573]|nr:hypothetical protein F5883DRAFT_718849 [Diaporthaceae sp. PMI_573]